jgi:hypothetical protein
MQRYPTFKACHFALINVLAAILFIDHKLNTRAVLVRRGDPDALVMINIDAEAS